MWKYVNSKCICVKSVFISPILDIIWRSNMVVKDHQQTPTNLVEKSVGQQGVGKVRGIEDKSKLD